MKREFVQEISVEAIALHAQVTTRTLLRLFSEDLGLSPKQVLTKYRVQEACRLLRETHLSVTNVAFESGFGSLSSFVESFRNQVGVLPSDYKAFHVRKSEKE
jgi:transcriptional regulator GlxA family with amidase domain